MVPGLAIAAKDTGALSVVDVRRDSFVVLVEVAVGPEAAATNTVA